MRQFALNLKTRSPRFYNTLQCNELDLSRKVFVENMADSANRTRGLS